MHEKPFEIHPQIYKYSHSAYSQRSFFIYDYSVFKLCEGTQQGDAEAPATILSARTRFRLCNSTISVGCVFFRSVGLLG